MEPLGLTEDLALVTSGSWFIISDLLGEPYRENDIMSIQLLEVPWKSCRLVCWMYSLPIVGRSISAFQRDFFAPEGLIGWCWLFRNLQRDLRTLLGTLDCWILFLELWVPLPDRIWLVTTIFEGFPALWWDFATIWGEPTRSSRSSRNQHALSRSPFTKLVGFVARKLLILAI